jgi:type IV secretion system protein TrbF
MARDEMSKQAKNKAVLNPFLDARREWNERFGEYVAAKRLWQSVALMSLALAGAGFWFGLSQAGKTKVVPYLVEVDQLNQVAYAGPIPSSPVVNPKILQALIAEFIRNFRGISVDAKVQRTMVDKVYAFLSRSDSATRTINEYYQTKENNPFERAKEVTVSVDVKTVLATSDKTYRVEWEETVYSRDGTVRERNNYRAEVSIALTPSKTGEQVLVNPLGLFITNFSFAGYQK